MVAVGRVVAGRMMVCRVGNDGVRSVCSGLKLCDEEVQMFVVAKSNMRWATAGRNVPP
jgi:hypothetical protein